LDAKFPASEPLDFDKFAARYQAATARLARSFEYDPDWVKEPKTKK
jgi:hypothetical protein